LGPPKITINYLTGIKIKKNGFEVFGSEIFEVSGNLGGGLGFVCRLTSKN
jgi:hypothetical protein